LNRVANTSLVTDFKSTMQLTLDQVVSALKIPTYVWVAMVLLAATGLCYSLNVHTRNELAQAKVNHQQVSEEIQQLELENARLARQIESIEKDPRTVETLAREAGMVAADETVIFLQPTAQKKPSLLKK
jgi:cell division protein FtsB